MYYNKVAKMVNSAATGVYGIRSWQKTIFLASALLILIFFSSSRSLTPVIWNDSLSFVESAILTTNNQVVYALNGVGFGYVAFISFFLERGLDFGVLIATQYLFLFLMVVAVIVVIVRIGEYEKNIFLVSIIPLVLLATYPGLHIYANIIYAEILFTTFVTLSLSSFLMGCNMSRQRTMLGWLFFSLVFAALAAITKSQGIAIFVVATILTALVVVRRYKRVAVAIWFIGFISTASFVVLVDASVQRTANPIAKLFGPKTLFCFYLNGYLAAENVRINSLKEFGFASEEFYERLLVSYRSPGGGFKTLGYNADACQFDRKIDEIAIQQLGGISQASSWYLRAFVSTIFEKPIPYLYKITSQILYSLKMSIPPHGLFSYNFGVDERRIIVKDLLTDAGFGKAASSFTVSGVAGSVLGHSESRALVYFYRLVSIIVGLFLVAPFLLVFFADFRRSKLLWMGMSASLFWFAQVGVIALIHSTDVWRYLIPVVPAALLCSALVGTMFIQQILRKRCAA